MKFTRKYPLLRGTYLNCREIQSTGLQWTHEQLILRLQCSLLLYILRGIYYYYYYYYYYYCSTALCWALAAFSVSWSYTQSVKLLGREISSSPRPLPTHRATQTQNKRTQTSTPRVGFEPTIPAFERAKTVHALDRGTTVIGREIYRLI
jgi:hypothetical protein